MGVSGKEDKETRIGTLHDLEPKDGNWEQVRRPTPVRSEGPRKRQECWRVSLCRARLTWNLPDTALEQSCGTLNSGNSVDEKLRQARTQGQGCPPHQRLPFHRPPFCRQGWQRHPVAFCIHHNFFPQLVPTFYSTPELPPSPHSVPACESPLRADEQT